jgi:hypothetical protein
VAQAMLGKHLIDAVPTQPARRHFHTAISREKLWLKSGRPSHFQPDFKVSPSDFEKVINLLLRQSTLLSISSFAMYRSFW